MCKVFLVGVGIVSIRNWKIIKENGVESSSSRGGERDR